jgi:hypothetical protein
MPFRQLTQTFGCKRLAISGVLMAMVAGTSFAQLPTPSRQTIHDNPTASTSRPDTTDLLPSRDVLLDRSDAIDQVLTHMALKHLPREYVDDKKWGFQAERWDGIRFERQEGRLETRRRKKLVNDGTWKRYTASLRNPQQEFQVQMRNLRQLAAGSLGFELHVNAHIDFKAQHVVWEKGVKLMSLTVEGHTLINARVDLVVNLQSEGSQFPPDLIMTPRATAAHLGFAAFRIDRIGKIGGEIAQQVGREAQRRLTEILPEYEQKLIKKINSEFGKKDTGYRFSFSELQTSKWSQALMEVLGQNAPAGQQKRPAPK